MGDLILNSFPVEISPTSLSLPFAEYDDWEASTIGRKRDYREYSAFRYDRTRLPEDDVRPGKRIRLLLLSGPSPVHQDGVYEADLGNFPSLGARLIEQTVSRYLESQGMSVFRTAFTNFALTRIDSPSGNLIQLYSGNLVSGKKALCVTEVRFHDFRSMGGPLGVRRFFGEPASPLHIP